MGGCDGGGGGRAAFRIARRAELGADKGDHAENDSEVRPLSLDSQREQALSIPHPDVDLKDQTSGEAMGRTAPSAPRTVDEGGHLQLPDVFTAAFIYVLPERLGSPNMKEKKITGLAGIFFLLLFDLAFSTIWHVR